MKLFHIIFLIKTHKLSLTVGGVNSLVQHLRPSLILNFLLSLISHHFSIGIQVLVIQEVFLAPYD